MFDYLCTRLSNMTKLTFGSERKVRTFGAQIQFRLLYHARTGRGYFSQPLGLMDVACSDVGAKERPQRTVIRTDKHYRFIVTSSSLWAPTLNGSSVSEP